MLKEAFKKRLINLVLIFFLIAAISIAVYFYLSAKTEINAVRTSINILKELSTDKSIFGAVGENLSKLSFLFLSQIVVFLVAIACTIFGLWFMSHLYLVENRGALIDPLTEIYNKRAMAFALDREIKRSIRDKHPISVAILDIDFFKKYNDSNGHVAGDRLLKRIAAIFKKSTREYDFVGRIGGEEFMILLPETSLKKASQVCERIRKDIENTEFPGEKKLPNKNVTISIGIAEFHGDKKIKRDVLIREADSYLYEAKESGRNRVVAR